MTSLERHYLTQMTARVMCAHADQIQTFPHTPLPRLSLSWEARLLATLLRCTDITLVWEACIVEGLPAMLSIAIGSRFCNSHLGTSR